MSLLSFNPDLGAIFGIVLVVFCAAIEGLAQVCLKKSALAAARFSPWLLLGLFLFGLEAVLYSGALRVLEVSVAYPVGALSFVAVILFSRGLLGEGVDRRRWRGVGWILVGCILVAG
ncbi:MAG: EamA family transporter [Magnetococcales bacterium]|nr:EamA family transporter [Magnetococcales bacterium]